MQPDLGACLLACLLACLPALPACISTLPPYLRTLPCLRLAPCPACALDVLSPRLALPASRTLSGVPRCDRNVGTRAGPGRVLFQKDLPLPAGRIVQPSSFTFENFRRTFKTIKRKKKKKKKKNRNDPKNSQPVGHCGLDVSTARRFFPCSDGFNVGLLRRD
ncbi:hypothetical protein GGR56DRAFT_623458 [Xylariaceae sp. FL0804]|nr:hypothetical protein GGR56DRAFT_623458 [Xylariaceae sp. FL0804]